MAASRPQQVRYTGAPNHSTGRRAPTSKRRPRTLPEIDSALLRRLLLAVVLIGEVGLLAELVLLEHTESAWQWAPIVLLLLALPITAAARARPARGTLRALQAMGALMLAAGALGVYLHYRGNVEFEMESDGALRGWTLFRLALQGATPALAPGALAQLGLTLLLAVYRHPALTAHRSNPE